ncbi:MAG: SRPBCC family protein [Pseudonocardiaceae bacterium]
MDEPQAALQTIDGRPVLRFERQLAHPPAKVWKAITDPAEMAHWFPAAVDFPAPTDLPDTADTELKPGATMRFTFPDTAPLDVTSEGEVLEFDPPKVYAFRWDTDVLRFELVPDGSGCRLLFSQTLGGGWVGGLAAGRNATGWDVCLDTLQAYLAGQNFPQPTDWLGPMERYIQKFGLDEGDIHETGDGYRVRFARDLVWKPVDEVWALLTEEAEPRVHEEPPLPATNGYVAAGPVTIVQAPHVLEYQWLHDGVPVGQVCWEIIHDPTLGTRVELTQTLPASLAEFRATALAAWHVQLELFFAATHGQIRCPWPQERTEELQKRYTERLG